MFHDREEAGRALAERLGAMKPQRPVVLALPRGGVPVALPVARALRAPLDLLMVRKLGLPGQPELAAGAVVDGETHEVVFNPHVLRASGLSEADFAAVIDARLKEIEERRERYLGGRAPVPVAGRTAIVVDDGIATGATVKAALRGLRARAPAAIVLAVPVAPRDVVPELEPLVDELICLETPDPFYAVGMHYRNFGQVSDAEVVAGLQEAENGTEKNG